VTVCAEQGQRIYLVGGGTENRQSMWLNTVDIFTPSTLSCMPATSLPKECAYGSVATIGQRLFYVGGGNGIDWFSSMLQLALDDEDAQWEQVSGWGHCCFEKFVLRRKSAKRCHNCYFQYHYYNHITNIYYDYHYYYSSCLR